MKENRNIKLLILLIVLGSATVLLFLFSNKDYSTVDKNLFKVLDQNSIDHIVFESPKGKVDLKFNGAKWMVNEKYEADAQLVTVFFASILQAEPKRKLSGSQQDSVMLRITKQGVMVSLLQEQEMMKQFKVVGNEQKTESYFQLINDDPYFITIPGYRVYVASIFELSESDWRDKRIFNFNWQNFKALKAHFPKQPKADFTVSLTNSLFTIEEVAVADTTKLSSYLESIFNLKAEKLLKKEEAKTYDSLFSSESIFQLDIRDIANHSYRLDIFYSKDKDQPIVAIMNGEQPIILGSASAARIIRQRNFFALKP